MRPRRTTMNCEECAVFPSAGGEVIVNQDADVDTVVFQGDYTLNGIDYTLTFNEMYVGANADVVISDVELVGSDIYSSGFLTLTGDNTYSGDTYVIEGELSVTGEIDNSAVAVGDGENEAVLSGSGTTGEVTVYDNGVLSPGVAGVMDGIGILSTGDLVFDPYSDSYFRVDATAYDSDLVDVEGTVTLGNANLEIISDLQEVGDDVLVLIENDGYDPIYGTFFELEEGDVVFVGNAPYFITYRYDAEQQQPDTGNDVALVPIKFEWVTPAGSPVTAPDQEGVGQNEFTFSDGAIGTIIMNLKVTVTQGDANKIKDKCLFSVKKIRGRESLIWLGRLRGS